MGVTARKPYILVIFQGVGVESGPPAPHLPPTLDPRMAQKSNFARVLAARTHNDGKREEGSGIKLGLVPLYGFINM